MLRFQKLEKNLELYDGFIKSGALKTLDFFSIQENVDLLKAMISSRLQVYP